MRPCRAARDDGRAGRSAIRQLHRGVGPSASADTNHGSGSSLPSSAARVAVAVAAARRHGRGGCPVAAMTRAPLTGADLYDWIALRRVSGGGMAKLGDRWLDSGHRVPGYVTEALAVLRGDGLVTLAHPPTGGMARAALTDAGAARYQQLCQQRQTALQMPAARFGTTCRRLGVNDPAPAGGTALPH